LRDEAERGMRTFDPGRFAGLSSTPSWKAFVAEESAEILGFLTLTEGDIEKPAQIHLIAVKEAHRGKGIGRELIRAGMEHVKGLGRKKLKLFTRPWNAAMNKVCSDLGFEREAYLKREYLDADLVQYSVFF
jgi:RimJ/RimL family protein N-acetyltransferase